MRMAAYCSVGTAEEAQVGSFEMQVQHFKSVIENNPTYELVKIYLYGRRDIWHLAQ
jgi:site-specific DNA recombinase